MKTIKREIVKVGTFGRMGGKPVEITKDIIKDLKETFDGKCPCTIGHQLADFMPKFGDVKKIEPESTDSSLVTSMEVHDLLADAIDEKFYADTSVGIERNLQGKYYLHHNAFLGAIPPKIRDLKVFSDLEIVCLADGPAIDMITPEERAKAVQRIMQSKRSVGYGLDEAKRAIADLAGWATEMAMSGELPGDLRENIAQLADKVTAVKRTETDPQKEEDVEVKEENELLKKKLADSEAASLVIAKDGLKKAMDGKIPKEKQDLVMKLADQLAPQEAIELSDAEGNKEKVSGLMILKRILEAIPAPVKTGRQEMGDTDDKPIDLSKLKGKF